MKHPLLLPLLLLGTVAACHLENHAPHLDSRDTHADLSQDLEGSGVQEGELALTEEKIQSEEEQVEASGYENDFDDDEDMESDPSDLDNDLECPRTEDTVEIVGSPGCKTCRYILVRNLRRFIQAFHTCRNCYRGNLVSVHNFATNYNLQCMTSTLNQGQVWIGGYISGWNRYRCFLWIDGSCWNYTNWAAGQPNSWGRLHSSMHQRGSVATCICNRRLPYICSV
ncbi:proteoglycan 3, pro eosinophil major basic protein 2 [Phyllostomus discolor]|uniref:Proteoglycan 3, pro eosinophil major basic protein 2 n=1 Tax=Phyllostomus discolor TaxID=89673 RepID=A0A833ZZ42_9CHIR|nr:proteoglycan 3, pro eosinophil major basic protein 2 [Phyllostomus discolor]